MRQKIDRVVTIATKISLCIILLCTMVVHATGGFIEQGYGIKNAFHFTTWNAVPSDIYPYNVDGIKIERVGFDTVYGTNKDLVVYTGEVPYPNTREADGSIRKGFEKIPYSKSAEDKGLTDKTYWGNTGVTDTNKKVTLNDLEAINSKKVSSLRLMALESAAKVNDIGIWLSKIFYLFLSLFTMLGSALLKAVIFIKNIDILAIMDAINIKDVARLINNIFIMGTDKAGNTYTSPFLIFALALFMIGVLKFVYNWANGREKKVSLWKDILLLFLVGVIIVVSSYNGNVTSLGNGFAKLSNHLIATTHGDMAGTNIFYTKTSGAKSNVNADLMATESSFVNKLLIDNQISAQFGVGHIDDLAFEKLGDTNMTIAKDILLTYEVDGSKITALDSLDDVENNLGYYFWWANSGANTLPKSSATIPDTGNLQEHKLGRVITYLQALYDKHIADGKLDKAIEVRNLVHSLSTPNIAGGAFKFILIAFLYVVMTITLYMYAIKALLSKVAILLATVSLPFAGVLILSTKKSWVDAGKALLAIFVLALIRGTVYSLFFDAIIIVIIKITTVEYASIIVSTAIMFLMMKLNPTIQERLEAGITSMEKAVSPQAYSLKTNARTWVANQGNNIQKWYNSKKRLVGYDDKGNPIYESREGDILSRTLGTVSDVVAGKNNAGFIRGEYQGRKIRKKHQDQSDAKIDSSADKLRRKSAQEAKENLRKFRNKMHNETAQYIKNTLYNEDGTYNLSQLSDTELETHNQMRQLEIDLDALNSDATYKELRRKKITGETFSDEEAQTYENYHNSQIKNEGRASQLRQHLKSSIQSRVYGEIRAANLDIEKGLVDKALETQSDYIAYGGAGNTKTNKLGLKNKIKPNYTQFKTEDFEDLVLLQKQQAALETGDMSEQVLTEAEKAHAQRHAEMIVQDKEYNKHTKAMNDATHSLNKNLLDENARTGAWKTPTATPAFRMQMAPTVTTEDIAHTKQAMDNKVVEPSTQRSDTPENRGPRVTQTIDVESGVQTPKTTPNTDNTTNTAPEPPHMPTTEPNGSKQPNPKPTHTERANAGARWEPTSDKHIVDGDGSRGSVGGSEDTTTKPHNPKPNPFRPKRGATYKSIRVDADVQSYYQEEPMRIVELTEHADTTNIENDTRTPFTLNANSTSSFKEALERQRAERNAGLPPRNKKK